MASASGIIDDPNASKDEKGSIRRIIPESRRADGSIRKERKVKPGYTPVEDIARFVPSRVRQARAEAASAGVTTNAQRRDTNRIPTLDSIQRKSNRPTEHSQDSSSSIKSLGKSKDEERAKSTSVDSKPSLDLPSHDEAKTTSSDKPEIKSMSKEKEVPDAWDDDEPSESDSKIIGKEENSKSDAIDDITKNLETLGIQNTETRK